MSDKMKARGRWNESAATRLRDSIVARVRGDDSESGVALLSAMIFMIIMAGISVVLLSTVLGQIVPSVAAQRNTRTIYAAQAGVQASLAMLRSAAAAPDSNGKVYGATSQLKCSLTGRVDAQDNGLSYSAQISYYTSDPTQSVSSTALSCTAAGVSGEPEFAMIKSQGLAAAGAGVGMAVTGSRYLSAVYAFRVTNINIPGGRIFNGDNSQCLEANTVSVGSVINFVAASACTASAINDTKQLWVYDTDYEIKLASTTSAGSTSLCITGPQNKADNKAQDATLQACKLKTDSARWNQLWSWTGSYTWVGQATGITSGYSAYYLAGPVDSRLQVNPGVSGTFTPASAVGAGAASVNTLQIVNYLQFGRCLDVTDGDIGSSYMISYPCKQDPSGTGTPAGTGKLDWNHKWSYTEPVPPASNPTGPTPPLTQTISVLVNNDSSKKYCLQTSAAASAPFYPTFKSCVTGQLSQKWTRIKNTGTYANSYLFVDNLGRCLAVGQSNDLYKGWSKIVATTCDNSLGQKWNAPAETVGGTVGGYQEYAP